MHVKNLQYDMIMTMHTMPNMLKKTDAKPKKKY